MDTCKWTYDEEHEYYDTECGEGCILITGNCDDNHYKYCPYCGKKIEEITDE